MNEARAIDCVPYAEHMSGVVSYHVGLGLDPAGPTGLHTLAFLESIPVSGETFKNPCSIAV